MGYILIDNLRFHAYHGVLPQERATGNDYVINLRIGYPIERACESDSIEDTLNYAEAANAVKEVMETPSCLLEHVAGRIIKTLRDRFPKIESVQIEVRKIAPPVSLDMDSAGVEMTWKCK